MRSWVHALAVAAFGVGGAEAGGDPSLVGKWRVETVRGAGAFDASKTTFEVAADGRVSSTVGCNRMVGKPTIAGDRIAFGRWRRPE